jgi:DNA-binding NtrC family response regulator
LIDHLLADIARRANRPVPQLDPAHHEVLRAYDWPGNVRELRNVLERAVISSSGAELRLLMPVDSVTAPPSASTRSASDPPPAPGSAVRNEEELRREERDNLLRALARTKGKIYGSDGAAAVLGLKPTTLASRLRKLKIPAGLRARSPAK